MNGFRELKSDYSREREKWSTVHGKIIVCQPSDVFIHVLEILTVERKSIIASHKKGQWLLPIICHRSNYAKSSWGPLHLAPT